MKLSDRLRKELLTLAINCDVRCSHLSPITNLISEVESLENKYDECVKSTNEKSYTFAVHGVNYAIKPTSEEIGLIRTGQTIAAIKLIRSRTGFDLFEAKTAVDTIKNSLKV